VAGMPESVFAILAALQPVRASTNKQNASLFIFSYLVTAQAASDDSVGRPAAFHALVPPVTL
jgi:hypothetical protein